MEMLSVSSKLENCELLADFRQFYCDATAKQCLVSTPVDLHGEPETVM